MKVGNGAVCPRRCSSSGERNERRRRVKSTRVTKGSGDVFQDLGFSPAQACNLRIRAELMTALRKFIENGSSPQAEAAKRLKVSQPRISAFMRGKISRFSLDALVNMLAEAGMEVAVEVKRSPCRVA